MIVCLIEGHFLERDTKESWHFPWKVAPLLETGKMDCLSWALVVPLETTRRKQSVCQLAVLRHFQLVHFPQWPVDQSNRDQKSGSLNCDELSLGLTQDQRKRESY